MNCIRQAFVRFFDAICAAVGLLCLAPVFAWLALWIVLDDGRPVFFSQTRVGRNGTRFRIWKFRTMRAGSEGSVITAAGDDRVTRIGATLRRLKLDELPQLFNVLKGEMALVGPRPEIPEHVQVDAPMWKIILQVRPGITDPASLLYRDEEEILGLSDDPNTFYRESLLPAKLLMNRAYLLSRSFCRDLRLIFLTIRYSLFPKKFDPDRIEGIFATWSRK
jgi:lipopolysaccharide/colanic/teichoic acid biosynthesis glycosyltransferase